jgi:hypothetical protein
MLTNPIEIEIIKNAQEPGIRDPKRPRKHFERIISRFFNDYSFKSKKLLDLGPGHYDFGELTRLNGAITDAIELDPTVIKLGEFKKMKVICGNLSDKDIFKELNSQYDLLFCRGSINACWFLNEETKHRNYLESLLSVLKLDGAAWISPCNEAPGQSPTDYVAAVEFQIQFFKKHGYKVIRCNPFQARWYGIWSDKPPLIFTKNLKYSTLPW